MPRQRYGPEVDPRNPRPAAPVRQRYGPEVDPRHGKPPTASEVALLGARALGNMGTVTAEGAFRLPQLAAGLVSDSAGERLGALPDLIRDIREDAEDVAAPVAERNPKLAGGAMLGAHILPYALTGGIGAATQLSALRAAGGAGVKEFAKASARKAIQQGAIGGAGLSGVQAAAGRDQSMTGLAADLSGNETLGALADNPYTRIPLDMLGDAGLAGFFGAATHAFGRGVTPKGLPAPDDPAGLLRAPPKQLTSGAPPAPEPNLGYYAPPPATVPETNPARLLGPGSPPAPATPAPKRKRAPRIAKQEALVEQKSALAQALDPIDMSEVRLTGPAIRINATNEVISKEGFEGGHAAVDAMMPPGTPRGKDFVTDGFVTNTGRFMDRKQAIEFLRATRPKDAQRVMMGRSQASRESLPLISEELDVMARAERPELKGLQKLNEDLTAKFENPVVPKPKAKESATLSPTREGPFKVPVWDAQGHPLGYVRSRTTSVGAARLAGATSAKQEKLNSVWGWVTDKPHAPTTAPRTAAANVAGNAPSKEVLTGAAYRDPRTNEIFAAEGFEGGHKAVLLPSGTQAKGYEEGFVTNTGRFLDRDQMQEFLRTTRGVKPGLKARKGAASVEALSSVAGAGLGAAAGAATGEEDDRLANAVLGAGLGAGVGALGARAGGRSRGAAKPQAPPAAGKRTAPGMAQQAAAPQRSAYEKGLYEETIGVKRDIGVAGGPRKRYGTTVAGERQIKMHPFMGPLDALRAAEMKKLTDMGKRGVTVSWDATKRMAKLEDATGLVRNKKIVLSTPETVALMNLERDMGREIGRLTKAIDAAPVGSSQRADLNSAYDDIVGKHLEVTRQLLDVGSEHGRALRALAMHTTGTLPDAMRLLRKALGTNTVAPELEAALAKLYHGTSGVAQKKAVADFIVSQVKLPWNRVVLGVRRMGMLTAPVTTAVNVTGNTVQAIHEEAIVTPLATALDKAWSALTGAERTMTTRGRGKGFAEGFGSKETRGRIARAFDEGGDVTERGFDAAEGLDLKRVDFARDIPGPAGRVIDGVGKVVYGMMAATDVPFWEAAYKSARGERAHLQAMREGLTRGSEKYAARIAHLADDANAGLDDVADAILRASDQFLATIHAQRETFKTPTPFTSGLVGRAGAAGEYVAPFVKTPTNLITLAMEHMPGIGLAVGKVERKAMGARLAQLGLDAKTVQREMRRETIKNLARQGTGAGMVMTGFMLSRAGLLTGDMPPIVGRDAGERDAQADARTRGAGPLTLRIGDRAHSLAAFAQFAPLLAMGHALAVEQELQEQEGQTIWSPNALASTVARGATSAGRTVLDLPMLQGVSDMQKFLENPSDPKTLGRQAGSFIPAGSAYLARASDASIAQRRGTDLGGERQSESFTDVLKERVPYLRTDLPLKVGPLGETQRSVSAFETLVSPTRPRRVQDGPLYDALEEVGFNPPMARQLPDEDYAAYSARRQQEGPIEQDILSQVLSGDPKGWSYLGPKAMRDLYVSGDMKGALASALAGRRSQLTDERNTRKRYSQLTLARP